VCKKDFERIERIKRTKRIKRALAVAILILEVLVVALLAAPVASRVAAPQPVLLKDWHISRVFDVSRANLDNYPHFYTIFLAGWKPVQPGLSGVVDISRHADGSGKAKPCVLARTIVHSAKRMPVTLSFKYSGEVRVFLNGKKVYGPGDSGSNKVRPPGSMGISRDITLTLEKGLNEIFLPVVATDGGWSFSCSTDRPLDRPVTQFSRLTKAWQTEPVFLTPESVRYDSKRDILYVTSFDNQYKKHNIDEEHYTGFISKVKLNGEIDTLKWVTRLNAPCGMCIYKDHLYTVERGSLAQIDIETGKLVKRYPIPDSDFLNDISVDKEGNIYMSDTRPSSHIQSRIYRFKDGTCEVWEGSAEIIRANGLFIHQNRLLVGNSGDGFLKAIDLADRKITRIVSLGAGIIDGIRVDNRGNYIVSHWEGQAYLVSSSGSVTKILDTMDERLNCADFEFVKEKNLLIIPSFLGNKVTAYTLKTLN
jgi:sugar lactone lactonase YvrE